MATKIQIKNNRIVFDGHADSLKDCQLITALCDNLSTSENFCTVKYESGYAEFEKISGGEAVLFGPWISNDVYVYSNDGSTKLFEVNYGESCSVIMQITETGVIFTDKYGNRSPATFTYSGSGKFLGLSLTEGATSAEYSVGNTYDTGWDGGITADGEGTSTLYIVEGEAEEVTIYQSKYTGEQIDEAISKANKSLITPETAPSAVVIPAINTANAQVNLGIGSGLQVNDEGQLVATGGGSTHYTHFLRIYNIEYDTVHDSPVHLDVTLIIKSTNNTEINSFDALYNMVSTGDFMYGSGSLKGYFDSSIPFMSISGASTNTLRHLEFQGVFDSDSEQYKNNHHYAIRESDLDSSCIFIDHVFL